MVKTSAPGKLMLFGEHAVLYGKPCLVAAIKKRLFLKMEKFSRKEILISTPEIKLPDFKVSF